ncbi:hypothetical protein QJS66_00595 [Kocuria rhizophila]|nr:hypothetical protein QJS66_00595 [Kocuria rhizophila]
MAERAHRGAPTDPPLTRRCSPRSPTRLRHVLPEHPRGHRGDQHLVGTGPFRLDSATPESVELLAHGED